MTQSKPKTVVVAMSGGVDSSVASYLLKKQGYNVIGISLKLWDGEVDEKRGKTCCSFLDIRDARSVCQQFDIPFYAFNYKNKFEENVIQKFVSEYKQGRTPNPCILCNNHVKFDTLLNEALKLGADYLATGHHARLEKDDDGVYHLLKGKDSEKDQSYVLYRLGQEELSKILFPIGDFTKEEVRALAHEAGIVNADKAESQDICFIPNRDHAAFIQKYYPDEELKPGNFVDKEGKIIGTHKGIHAYTVGQRRGLGISSPQRLYVIKIDKPKNEVVLGLESDLNSQGLIANEVNWVHENYRNVNEATECGVKIRYQKDEIPALIESQANTDEAVIRFWAPEGKAVSPGQSAVFYRGDEVIGGGWIEKAL